MSVTTLIEFDDASEHTFDSALLILTGDRGLLKSLVSSNEVLFSNFDTNSDVVSKRGAKTIVFGGTANTGEVLGGVLNFPNQDGSKATYSNIVDIVDDFAFRCKVNSNVTTVSGDRDLVVLDSNNDQSRIRFLMVNAGGGLTRISREIRDSSGSITANTVLTTEDLSTDPNFEIAFSNDDNGNTLTFFNGVIVSTIASPSFDFTDSDIVFGDTFVATSDYDDFQLFKSDEITAAFAFPFPEPTTFSIAEKIMKIIDKFFIN